MITATVPRVYPWPYPRSYRISSPLHTREREREALPFLSRATLVVVVVGLGCRLLPAGIAPGYPQPSSIPQIPVRLPRTDAVIVCVCVCVPSYLANKIITACTSRLRHEDCARWSHRIASFDSAVRAAWRRPVQRTPRTYVSLPARPMYVHVGKYVPPKRPSYQRGLDPPSNGIHVCERNERSRTRARMRLVSRHFADILPSVALFSAASC